MSRAVRTVSGPPYRARFRLVIVAAICVPCIGLILLFLAAPSRKQPSSDPVPRSTPAPDRGDAASAALTFAQELAVTGVSESAIYGPRLREIAAPGSESRVRAA